MKQKPIFDRRAARAWASRLRVSFDAWEAIAGELDNAAFGGDDDFRMARDGSTRRGRDLRRRGYYEGPMRRAVGFMMGLDVKGFVVVPKRDTARARRCR